MSPIKVVYLYFITEEISPYVYSRHTTSILAVLWSYVRTLITIEASSVAVEKSQASEFLKYKRANVTGIKRFFKI